MCNGSRWIIYTHLGGWSSILEIANVPGFHQFHHERMKSIDESGSCSQKIYELWIWTPQPWGFPLVSISIGLAPVINKSSMTRDGILPKKKTIQLGGTPMALQTMPRRWIAWWPRWRCGPKKSRQILGWSCPRIYEEMGKKREMNLILRCFSKKMPCNVWK